MSHRALLSLVAAAALLTVPAGCGIPGHTEVRVDGGGQLSGADSGGVFGRLPPKRAESGDAVDQLALNYLSAAAGEAGTAYERVAEFVAPSSRHQLATGQDVTINVVRLRDGPSVTPHEGNWTVTIAVDHVGVLRPDGVLQPPVLQQTTYTFEVGKVPAGDMRRAEDDAGLYVLTPPPVLLMSVDALNDYYGQLNIYFWSRDDRQLVPDLRYLPWSVPPGRRPTEVLGWLTGGPADWLDASVEDLPDDTKTIGNAAESDGRLVVNLAIDPGHVALDAQLRRLATQLVWSLREVYPHGRLELMIRDQSRAVFDVDEWQRQNPVYPGDDPARYSILGGIIYPVREPEDVVVEPPPVAAAYNRDIVSADAVRNRGSVSVALVTRTGRLLVGSGRAPVEKFDVSPTAYPQLGQPSWLQVAGSPHPVGLIVAAGRLYRFGPGARLDPVGLSGVPGPVSAVSSALDGRRIAFIAGDRLYVAGVTAIGTVEIDQPRLVPTSLRRPTAVAWGSENMLVVAGHDARGRAALKDVTVDGGVELLRVKDLGSAKVSRLVASPYNPVRGDYPQVMYEANDSTWNASPEPNRIDVADLAGVDERLAAARTQPTAPFFLY